MKNVLVFVLGGGRYAVELRWVREVITLGPMTPVPTASGAIAGVVSFRGAIVPVVHVPPLLPIGLAPPPGSVRAPRAGDAAILVEVEGLRAALAVGRIDEVTTLAAAPDREGALADPRGRVVPLMEPPAIVAAARRMIARAAEAG